MSNIPVQISHISFTVTPPPVELGGPSPCLQQPATGPYPGPRDSSAHAPTQFFNMYLIFLSSDWSASFSSKIRAWCATFSLSYVLHAPPTLVNVRPANCVPHRDTNVFIQPLIFSYTTFVVRILIY
jgi:hypothetical protein